MQSKQGFMGFLFLLLTAFIWGTSFVAQAGAAHVLEAFTINAVRCPMGALVLIPVIMWRDKKRGLKPGVFDDKTPQGKKDLLLGGLICGLFMAGGAFFQTAGLYTTTVAKSGFLTAIYVILVPIFGSVFLHTFVRRLEWLAALLSCVGMYFICITEDLTIGIGDIYTIICALCYAGQVLSIGIYVEKVDSVRLSFLQLVVVTLVSCLGAALFEHPHVATIMSVFWELFYIGVFSAGIGYTLQIVGQVYVNAATACVTLSLESVFALLSGIVLVNQIPTFRETVGCVLVFAAVLLAQLPSILPQSSAK